MMADWYRRESDGARAKLHGISPGAEWPPSCAILELEGKDGEYYRVADWHFIANWERSEPLEYSAAELRERRRRL